MYFRIQGRLFRLCNMLAGRTSVLVPSPFVVEAHPSSPAGMERAAFRALLSPADRGQLVDGDECSAPATCNVITSTEALVATDESDGSAEMDKETSQIMAAAPGLQAAPLPLAPTFRAAHVAGLSRWGPPPGSELVPCPAKRLAEPGTEGLGLRGRKRVAPERKGPKRKAAKGGTAPGSAGPSGTQQGAAAEASAPGHGEEAAAAAQVSEPGTQHAGAAPSSEQPLAAEAAECQAPPPARAAHGAAKSEGGTGKGQGKGKVYKSTQQARDYCAERWAALRAAEREEPIAEQEKVMSPRGQFMSRRLREMLAAARASKPPGSRAPVARDFWKAATAEWCAAEAARRMAATEQEA
jgi:hypothetical protein